MGIIKNILGIRKNETETGDTSTLAYADELCQIYDNYCQGFLSQEEYEFQTGLLVMGTGTWGMLDKFKFYQKNLEV